LIYAASGHVRTSRKRTARYHRRRLVFGQQATVACRDDLSRGDSTVTDANVPGYLRFQMQAARQAGLNGVADALARAADAYAQGLHGLGYSILLDATVPPDPEA